MIGTNQVVNGLWMGTILILLGLVPGLYQALGDGIAGFAHLLTFRHAFPSPQTATFDQPRWLVASGLLVMAATFLAYFAG